jgi:hypothetical protein
MEECVDCGEGNVTTKVLFNEDKPFSPPAPGSIIYATKLGDVVSANLTDTTAHDVRYELEFTNFAISHDVTYNPEVANVATEENFNGIVNVDDDGNFKYGNAPAGNLREKTSLLSQSATRNGRIYAPMGSEQFKPFPVWKTFVAEVVLPHSTNFTGLEKAKEVPVMLFPRSH